MAEARQETSETYACLTSREVEDLGRELDALRQRVLDSRGAADAAYIRRVIAAHAPLSWPAGTAPC